MAERPPIRPFCVFLGHLQIAPNHTLEWDISFLTHIAKCFQLGEQFSMRHAIAECIIPSLLTGCSLIPNPKPPVAFTLVHSYPGKTAADLETLTARLVEMYDPACKTFVLEEEFDGEVMVDQDGNLHVRQSV